MVKLIFHAHLIACWVLIVGSFVPSDLIGSMKRYQPPRLPVSSRPDKFTKLHVRMEMRMPIKKPESGSFVLNSPAKNSKRVGKVNLQSQLSSNLENKLADPPKTSFMSIPEIPVGDSILEVVEGSVPEWLRGSFYRNGPGMFNAGSQELDHLFDGYALLNKFEFRSDGKVSWRANFLQSEAYRAAKSGEMKYHEFGTSAGTDFWSRAVGIARALAGGITDNACVSIQRLDDGTMLALTESILGTYEFDESSLATGKRLTWDGDYVGQLNTAHPLPDGVGQCMLLPATPFICATPPHDTAHVITQSTRQI
jgi:hypothetical protein